ncbi:MAG: 5'-methylthioadenosine/S-adenosylhomocysteine nucleosidase [Termitinemataceae bacterium]|jgi:adenosylhomocysteine nucleosidase|nr:MAG: 5'-methylthioadenosine/S-adenosylhomocysteine nucleosidase [Termitinemataceae bacterium]
MIGIVGAMEEEVTLLRDAMSNLKVERSGEIEFFLGDLCGKKVVLLRCGIGKVHAAVGCSILIEKYSPGLIINTGCAGGVNPDGFEPLSFGDLVISSGCVYHDFDISAFGYQRGQVPGRKDVKFTVDADIIKLAEEAVLSLRKEKKLYSEFKMEPGLIASGDIFVYDSRLVMDLVNFFPELRAVDMESAAIAHACDILGTRFVAFRCLSDVAGEESPVKFDEYLPVAVKNSSEIVKRLVEIYED